MNERQQMTPQQALAFIDQLASRVAMNREDTMLSIQALRILAVAIATAEPPKTERPAPAPPEPPPNEMMA